MTELPTAADSVPTPRTLLRTSLLAAVVAAALLFGAVLPAEYGVDPTGVGRLLGLTQMGKLKLELMQEEAALQKSLSAPPAVGSSPTTPAADPARRSDSMTVTLTPAQGIEVKLEMTKDQVASYRWDVDSGAVFFDLHGQGPKPTGHPTQRYGQGILHSAQGEITAAFDGMHGWYWENRTNHDVQVTVKAWGQFKEMKQM